MSPEESQIKRLLALDFGDRRTGLAATDYTGSICTPLPALVGLNDADCVAAIVALVQERECQTVIIGLPLTLTGEYGPRAQRTQTFSKLLQQSCPCPVVSVDERYSTEEAHGLLSQAGMKASQRRKLEDSVAALVILRRYLAGR